MLRGPNRQTMRAIASARFRMNGAALAAILVLVGQQAVQSAPAGGDPGIAGGKKDDDKIRPVPQPSWSFVSSVLRALETPDAGRTGKLKETLNEIATLSAEQITGLKDGAPVMGADGKPASPRTDLVVKLYEALPFEMVRELADKGIEIRGEKFQLDHQRSVALAIVRDHMINETYRMMEEKYGADFVRLDFGNKLSGMKSDVDHTAHAAWEELERAIKATGEKGGIREAFGRLYQNRWKISQEACDICIHSGKNTIPDWRHGESVQEFDAKMREVLKGLIGTPDAYFQEGAWRMQVEMRSIAGAEKVTKQLHEIMVKLGQEGLSADERGKLEAEKARVLENNPCTRFLRDPKTGKIEISKDASILEALFRGVNKDILKLYSFDSCIGNYLFYLHHHDKWRFPKYPLRAFEEGVSLLRHTKPGETLKPLLYGELTHQERYISINELYPNEMGFDEAKRKEIKRVLDVTADLRDNHKAPPEKQRSEAELWKPIIDHLKGEGKAEGLDESKLIEIAKQEYERSSVAMMVWSNERTARARTAAWLEPGKYPELLKLIEGEAGREAKITKLQFASYYALKLAFRYLSRAEINRIIASQPDPRYKRDLKILDDVIQTELRLYGRTQLEPGKPGENRLTLRERMKRSAVETREEWEKSYKDFWVAVRDNHYSPDAVTARVWDSIYETLGFGRKVEYELLKVKSSKWGEGVFEVKREWKVENALGNLINAGNALSAINVLRVYQQGGDRDAVIAAIVAEGLYRLPGLVHLMAGRDACHGDFHGVKFLATSAILDRLKKYAIDQALVDVNFGALALPSGHALIYFMVAEGAIQMLGYEIFEPLTTDAADLMYQGRIARPAAPPEFTDADGRELATLQRMIEKNRARLLNVDFKSDEMRKLLDETRGYLASVREIEAKQKTWEAHKKALERYDAGIVRAGIKDPVEASFDPILHESRIPLKFFFGSLEGDAGGPVDLTAKPLTDQERNRLENLRLMAKGLETDAQGIELPERIGRLCGAMDEADELEEREREAERAKRYLDKIRSDPEWRIDALRQNLASAIEPIVNEKVRSQGYPSHEEMVNRSSAEYVRYSELRDKEAISATSQYAQKWFDESHPQTRNLVGLTNALGQVKARMIADYQNSVEACEEFEKFRLAQSEARRERQAQRRAFLEHLAVQDAMKAFLAKGTEECADYGFMVMAGGAPHEEKGIVRLSGYVEGEGEDKTVRFRVKVIASTFKFKEPYKIEMKAKGGNKKADGAKEVLLFAEVRDAEGKEVGRSQDIPAVLRESNQEPVTLGLATGVCDWGMTNNHGVFEGVVVSVPAPEPAKGPGVGQAAGPGDAPTLGDRFSVYRSRSAEGPWLSVATHVYKDTPFLLGPGTENAKYAPDRNATLDEFPSGFVGRHRWFYTAIPKESAGDREAGVPEGLTAERTSDIEVNITVPSPEIKLGVARVPGKLTPEEQSDKEARERQQAAGLAPAGGAAPTETDSLEAEKKAFFGKREEQEGWFSWSPPALPPPLDRTPKEHCFMEMSFRAAAGAPWRGSNLIPAGHRGLAIDAYEPGWIWPGMAFREGLYPGMPYTIKARWVVRTFGGTVASDWREYQFTLPPLRLAGDSGGDIRLSAGQAIQITCVKALVTGDEKEGFTPRGPEGTNEGEHRAYTEKKRDEAVKGFWNYHDNPEDRQGERHAKLQKEIETRLKKDAWQLTDWQKAHARLPGAPLGALIGEFVSEAAQKAYDEQERQKRAAAANAPPANNPAAPGADTAEDVPEDPFADRDKGPAAAYFLIGKGAAFTAPEPGRIRLMWNWPMHGASSHEYVKQLLYTVSFTSGGQAPPAPVPGSPRWEPEKAEGGGLTGKWKFEFSAPAAPEGIDVEVFAAAEQEGPWKGVPFDRQQDRSIVVKNSGLVPGHWAWYRTRAVQRGSASHGTESWSAPVELRLEPEPAQLSTDGRLSYFGKRDQTLRVKAAGNWQPVQVTGTNLTYGADGVGDDLLMEPLQKKLEVQVEEERKRQEAQPPMSREEAKKQLDELRAQKAQVASTLSAGDRALIEKIEAALEAVTRGEKPALLAPATAKPDDVFRQLRRELQAPAAPFGCLLGIFEPTPPLAGGDLYQRPGGFSAPVTTVFRAGDDWVFRFPEDGILSLVPNRLKYDKQGDLIVRGAGALTIDVMLSAPD